MPHSYNIMSLLSKSETLQRKNKKKSPAIPKDYGGTPLWALRDSNPRPSACKADALNQLS